jgi:hypothetical protein
MNTENNEENKPAEPVLVVVSDDITAVPTMKSGYQWLREMILIRNFESSYKPKPYPVTNRACFIINALNQIGVPYTLDIFSEGGVSLNENEYNGAKLVNIIVKFESTSGKPAVVFCAHHDVANSKSQNCQDNSASVCNLLHLAAKIKAKGQDLTRPVIIVFTDKEEFGGVGAHRMSMRILAGDFGPVDYVINLELTGLGNQLWLDTDNSIRMRTEETPLIQRFNEVIGKENYHEVSTPFSDAVIFRSNGLDCLCIGILPEEQLATGGRKETWWLCHSMDDTIDKTDEIDMALFVEKLELFAA